MSTGRETVLIGRTNDRLVRSVVKHFLNNLHNITMITLP